jgi:Fur family peroxide stress response transcriptional regulator
MNLSQIEISKRLTEKGLKVTPQRMAILEAVYNLPNHPTADLIISHIRKNNPNIASGTVYKVLDVLVEKQILKRVKTEKDVMRYDGVLDPHHHLYCAASDKIQDYTDQELDKVLKDYFKNKEIPGFQIEDIKLEIKGRFTD